MPLTASLLLLADSRLPAGGHAHSGGMEAATVAGLVGDEASLEDFLRGRLATAGLAAAGLAAAACAHAAEVAGGAPACWAGLDAEAAARTPSPAQRAAARVQGRALLRAARAAWPHPVLDSLAAGTALAAEPAAEGRAAGEPAAGDPAAGDPAAGGPSAPYHPVVLGACAWITGGTPGDAALIAATGAITSPASAAIRLLGLDPLAVTGLLARLGPETAAVAAQAAGAAEQSGTSATDPGGTGTGSTAAGVSGPGAGWAGLPAPASPGLDMLAERHAREEVALFES
jgi:urease accessory protein